MSTTSLPTKGSKVLLTGASGFLAIHVAEALFDQGFKIVGTVRSNEKGDYLKELFKGKPFEYVIVEDVGKDDAFDEAVKGVEAVVHTASPFHVKADEPSELIQPAVDGTIGVLKSALKNGKDVKRVVITSSVASIENLDKKGPYTWTEADWNTFSEKEINEKGREASGADKYYASKTLAERAAWSFIEENKPSFDLVTICPPYVFGPVLQDVPSIEKINTSVGLFVQVIDGSTKDSALPGPVGNWVDVREVAVAHAKALVVPEAGGERFIVSAGPFCLQDFADAISSAYPDLSKVPKGKAGAAKEANDPKTARVFDGSKATRVLGVKYRPIEETSRDVYESLKAKKLL
ncbi:putative dihydrokaempferol 4-reductase [Mrakia frigida]|uniref:SDR family oxidoreductase n=1 Tax=Mrakia frigida TaxID=29902 RepID=UPI003FCC237E